VVVGRDGRVHEIDTIISDNPGLDDAAHDYIHAMHFRPYLLNNQPVQVLARLTFPFKTTRPAGIETFDSARNYFEHARHLTSAAGGSNTTAYILHATFEASTKDGVGHGQYTDTWLSDTQWCREATINQSRFSRCRNGDKWYLFAQGTESYLLQVVLKSIEPVPAIDTFVESDWRVMRKTVDGKSLIRVATGHESDDGVLDAQSRGLWFDSDGLLMRTHFRGLDTIQAKFEDFQGAKIPRQIDVLANGKLAMRVQISSIEKADHLDAGSFKLSGHDWKRQFTDEAR
jgi:outer membrane lipoprotein-sorting protein